MEKRESWLSKILRSLISAKVLKEELQSGKGHTALRSRSGGQARNFCPQFEARVQETPLYEAPPWEVNRVLLNEFIVEGILGQGGMGTVYLVVSRKSDGERFAVKTLLSTALEDEERNRLFMRELRTWMALQEHPHIAAFRFFRTIEDRLAIFAEYVDGGTLHTWIRDQKLLSLEMILDVAIQCAWGLQAAHVQKVVHQDVKPANVLMTKDGLAKITDFGLARALHEGGIEKLTGGRSESKMVSVDGMTEAYCSPEQASWQKLTHRTDIWSFGLSVLEMFTGSVTWSQGSIAKQALGGFIDDGPKSPYPAMPEDVAAVLRRCFQEDPAQRWNNLGEVADVLRETYLKETGQIYSRKKPVLESDLDFEGITLDRKTLRWDNPKKWLARALRFSGRDESELDSILNEQQGSRKVQALLDLEIYEQALYIYTDLAKQGMINIKTALAVLMMNKAFVHEYVADVPEAIAIYDKAIQLFERLLKKKNRSADAARLARAYMCRGSATSSLGDNHSAMEFYDRSIQLWKRLVKKDERSDLAFGIVSAYIKKGVALRKLGDKCSALLLFDETIQLLERLMKKYGRSELSCEFATVYMNKGSTLVDLGDNSTAVVLYDKAIQLLEFVVNKENRSELADVLAMAYMNKGGTLYVLGDKSSALMLYDKAIQIRERLVKKEGRSELFNDLALVYMNKAIVVGALGDHHTEMELYGKAIQIRERLVNKEGCSELTNELALVYMNLAGTVGKLGDQHTAVALYNKAIQNLERLVYNEGRTGLANDLAAVYMNKANILGDDHTKVKIYDMAIQLLKRLIKKDERSELLGDLAWAKTMKSKTLYNLGEMKKAKKEVKAALPILRSEAKRTGRAKLKNVLNLAEAVSNKLIK